MIVDLILNEIKNKTYKLIKNIKHYLKNIKINKLSTDSIGDIIINAYGKKVLIKQVANIKLIDNLTLLVKPYNNKLFKIIDKEINLYNCVLSTIHNNKGIIVKIPILSYEDKIKLIKLTKIKIEYYKIKLRKYRRIINKHIKGNNNLSMDDRKKIEKEIDNFINKKINYVSELFDKKKEEILI